MRYSQSRLANLLVGSGEVGGCSRWLLDWFTRRRGLARSRAVLLPARLFWLRACPCDPGRRELCRVGGWAAEFPVGAGRRGARASQRQSVGCVPESGCI